jgi:hypothetical protein
MISAFDIRDSEIGTAGCTRGRQRNARHDIVGRTCASVNETQNSFAAAMQTSRAVDTAVRVTFVSGENSFPFYRERRDIASTRPRDEGTRSPMLRRGTLMAGISIKGPLFGISNLKARRYAIDAIDHGAQAGMAFAQPSTGHLR